MLAGALGLVVLSLAAITRASGAERAELIVEAAPAQQI
jgi:hypothetical protein